MNISHIPSSPWVYLFKDRKEKILYVGKAKNLAKRVSQYFTPWSVRKQDMVAKAIRVDFIEVRNESEALYLEDNLIKTNNPEYNRLLKWDNSYIYLKITKEEFPQLFLTRMRKNDGATYIGPKNNTWDLRKLMHYLRQIYKYRTMKSGEFKQGKLSSDIYFGLDKGWSVIAKYKDNIIARNDAIRKSWIVLDKSYEEYKREYKDIVKSITSFFEGNTKEVKNKIMNDIDEAISKEHFERCINLKTILTQIDAWTEKQHVVLAPNYSGHIITINELKNYRVIIMIKIFEGKITDVIREKKLKDEWSLNQMKASLEIDLKEVFVMKENDSNTWWSVIARRNDEAIHSVWRWTTILYSSSLKTLRKAQRKEINELLEKFLQSYIASTTFDTEENLTQDLLQTLQDRYHLHKFPYRVECIDISHFSGSAISGWLSCMQEWLLYKHGYRHYKIKTLEDTKWNYSNDFLSLQEIVVRRFGLKKKISSWQNNKAHIEYPDVFILDGGQGQLNILRELCQIFPSLQKIMQENTSFIALGKGKARKESAKSQGETEMIYYFNQHWEIQSLALIYDTADRLLTKLRDEAHRFANKYRTMRMGQEWK